MADKAPMRWLCVLVLLASPFGCSGPFPERPPGANDDVVVTLQPEGRLSEASPLLRMRVGGLPVPAAALHLFDGEVGPVHERRIIQGELPATVAAREIPTTHWIESASGKIVVAPQVRLARGPYTLAAVSHGLIASLQVGASGRPYYSRFWPPRGEERGAGHLVYCGQGPAAELPAHVVLAPTESSYRVGRGIDGSGARADHCLHLTPENGDDGADWVLPPLVLGGVNLDPAPIPTRAESGGKPPFECTNKAVAFGPGCAFILDDRALVRGPPEPTLWIVETGGGAPTVAHVRQNGAFVVLGLTPSKRQRLELTVYDAAGRRTRYRVDIDTGPPRPHVVISEVFANPFGAEPAQEWVELVNTGSRTENLAGYVLEDGAGVTVLPERLLPPGQYALVVNDDYAPAPEIDPVPPAEALIVVVPEIGKSGLSNTGEELRLRNHRGGVVSRFPAEPKPKAGVSVARRTPHALDAERTTFGYHAGPGASPGVSNRLADEEEWGL